MIYIQQTTNQTLNVRVRGLNLLWIFSSVESSRHSVQKCINFQMRIGWKLFNFIILYRSPSQSQNDFEAFLKKKSNLWCKSDTTSCKAQKARTKLLNLDCNNWLMSQHINFIFMYWFDIYLAAKSSDGICCTLFATQKLSSSNNLGEVSPCNLLSTSSWTGHLVLSKTIHRIN